MTGILRLTTGDYLIVGRVATADEVQPRDLDEHGVSVGQDETAVLVDADMIQTVAADATWFGTDRPPQAGHRYRGRSITATTERVPDRQGLTPAAIEFLRRLHGVAQTCAGSIKDGDPRRRASIQLNAALHSYRCQGVSIQTLADVLSVAKRTITGRLEDHRDAKPRREKHLSAEIVAELRALREVGKNCRGNTPQDDPARKASIAFTHALQSLADQGFTAYGMAQDLGLTAGAIATRLNGHGQRPPSPDAVPDASEPPLGQREPATA